MKKLAIGFAALIAILSYCGGTPAEATCPPGTRDNWPTCTPIVTTTTAAAPTTIVPPTTTPPTTVPPTTAAPTTVAPTTTDVTATTTIVATGVPPTLFPPESEPLVPPTDNLANGTNENPSVCVETPALCAPAPTTTDATAPATPMLPSTGGEQDMLLYIATLAGVTGLLAMMIARRPKAV